MALFPSLDNLRGLLQKVIFVPIVYGFISILPIFLTGWENSDRIADRLLSTIRSKENTFDFIVVGGGTAGALVANRLAEHYRVLLLEAGGTPMPLQTIPALALKFLNHPQTDWSHKTVPQRLACLNSINQQSRWSSGRGLGGTTNINFMTHLRGHPSDYENWAVITDDPTWGYAGVLPYFKRYETFSGTSNDPGAHGHDGEMRIRKPSYVGLADDWIRAGLELRYPFVDLNGMHEEGFGTIQYPMYKGIRQSTYSSFLLPMHKSPRLIIRRYALVRKILFRDTNNMAYGVEYVRHGRIENAIATKEVVLSAGTLGSSKLLMLSGVGPRQHLEELGIPVRSELPVGRNLQDHLGVHLGPFFINEPKSFLFDRDVTPENIVRWLFLGTGPITTTGYQGAASIASSVAKSQGEGNWPDLHLILHGQAIHQGYTDAFAYAYGLQEDDLMQYYQNAVGRDSFHIYVVGSRPTSTGQVLLSGASITDPLVINPRYFEGGGNRDFKILLEGVKTAFSITNTSVFHRMGTEFTKARLPGCHEFEFLTDAYWECYIRRFTLSMNNPVGTVSLGQVVDTALRVRGTRGLRVIDASIQPTLVSTGTAASTLMIAEKGVDFILKEYGIPDREADLFDVIFGKHGFLKKNPFLKILQREFDTLNPLRALFKPFTIPREDDVVKERFTRNGRLDNPLLQIISTLFGNSNLNQPDSNSNVLSNSVEVDFTPANATNGSTLQRRSTEPRPLGNVISKSQWTLQPTVIPIKANDDFINIVETVPKKLKIKEVLPSGKGKGGKRYALLQKILKEMELNATLAKTAKLTSTVPTISTTQIVKPTVKPVIEVVKFEKPVSSSENEVDITNTKNSNNLDKTLGIVAKPILVHPPQPNYLPISAPPNTGNIFVNTGRATGGALTQLFKGLNSFEELMRSLTPRNQPTTQSPKNGNLFTVSQTRNFFHNNGNVFNFLQPINPITPNVTANALNSTGIQTRSTPPASNPFDFLFGNKNQITTPSSIPISQSSTTANASANSLAPNKNLISSWFKPLPPSQSTQSWFKPFEKHQTSSSSWFKPLNDKTWLNPFGMNDKSSSWFKPFNFNSKPTTPNSLTSSVSVSTTSPPTDPLGNLFDLFLGGLKRHERKAVFETLDTMLTAGESLADILDLGGGSGGSQNGKDSEQASKGKRFIKDAVNIGLHGIQSGNADEFIRSLIAVSDVLGFQSTSKAPSDSESLDNSSSTTTNPPPTEKPPTQKPTTIKPETVLEKQTT